MRVLSQSLLMGEVPHSPSIPQLRNSSILQFHPSQTQQPSTCRVMVTLPLEWKLLSWCIRGSHLHFSHLQPTQDELYIWRATRTCTATSQKASSGFLLNAKPHMPYCERFHRTSVAPILKNIQLSENYPDPLPALIIHEHKLNICALIWFFKSKGPVIVSAPTISQYWQGLLYPRMAFPQVSSALSQLHI